MLKCNERQLNSIDLYQDVRYVDWFCSKNSLFVLNVRCPDCVLV